MKIGIGVCTYKRPVLATRVCKQILETINSKKHNIQTICSLDDVDSTGYEWISKNFGLITAPNRGVSINKNRLLNYLQDCDVIFLVEDDIEFIKSDWIDLYLKVINETNFQHLNFITSAYIPFIQKIEQKNGYSLGYSKDYVNGVLMVITKQCLKRVGGFDIRFGNYGFEHVNYTKRCIKAGLHPPEFLHVMESSEYIHWTPTVSTITEQSKIQFLKKSNLAFTKKIRNIFLPIKEFHQKIYLTFTPFFKLRFFLNLPFFFSSK